MYLTALVLVGGYEDGFRCQREPNSRRFISYEDKRCMLVSAKWVADFSRGCAHPEARALISTTPPPTASQVANCTMTALCRSRGVYDTIVVNHRLLRLK
jgi:hypothetical protein